MTKEPASRDLQRFARVSGLLYLIVIGAGLFAEAFVRQKLMIAGDAVATVNQIESNERLFRLGFVADLVNFICGLPVIVFFWSLFRKYQRIIATVAIFFAIISNAVFAANIVNQLHPLLMLSNHSLLQTFQPAQLAALAAITLDIQEQGYAVGLVFFGCYCIIIGCLILKTNYIPRIFGLLYALAGVCYMLNSFIMFLSRGFDNPLFPYILFPAFAGELSVALYLLLRGIRLPERDEVISY